MASYRLPQAGQPPANKVLARHSPPTSMSAWSLGQKPKKIDSARKTAIIDRELKRLNIDIAALQETQLSDSGSLKEKAPSSGTSRVLSLRLTSSGPTNILSIYALTPCSATEVKDQFYEELEAKIRLIPKKEHLFLLGDFNARVGADHDSWLRCIGHFGVGKLNENGQHLLELCSFHDLCLTNTFPTKPLHRMSWRHPRSRHWHQLDLVISRRSLLNQTCPPLQAEAPTRINIARTNKPELREHFAIAIDKALEGCPTDSATKRWNHIPKAVFQTALDTFGRRERKSTDWFKAGIAKLELAIAAKRAALIAHKKDPSTKTLVTLWTARKDTQKIARPRQRARDVQGHEEGFRPKPIKTAPLKSAKGEIIKDRCKQMKRWAEHYKELYSRETTVTSTALESTQSLPPMVELDTPPTIEELSKAVDNLANGKAPGSDNIPPEVVKATKESSLLQHLYELLMQCWEEGAVPQDMCDGMIVTLYKNKEEWSDCNNYRGISLLSIVGKAFARVTLNRLQLLAERVYLEAQCGFRAARSTVDMVFSVRQLQEKCREQRQPLYLAFIDLTKAFDMVSRDGLFALLQRIGCPPKLLSLIVSFHQDMSGTDSEDGVFIHTRSSGGLFNLVRLWAKTKIQRVLVRELFFADDSGLVAHTETALQRLIDRFSTSCAEFGLTISLRKTKVMGQDVSSAPSISIGDHTLEVVEKFIYLGSTISSNFSLVDRQGSDHDGLSDGANVTNIDVLAKAGMPSMFAILSQRRLR
ncbi:uncharacterized protein LOC119596256 [Penaeus monodon]|uniref:uncharacterized protein LOC119596256 n=1 Tax=Penaeus monodon TaxID=6687 RepID=UPI0018A78BE0|nr:uncharacterized protein LOC119596256 [Penaeus monodon]